MFDATTLRHSAAGRRLARAAVMGSCLFMVVPALAADGDPQRGRQIYVEGSSPGDGAINAIVGDEEVVLPGGAVPCASCHGRDGLGRPEGGVLPPDIRWSELVKIYGHVHEDGRRHPAFDDASIARLIRAGIDPGDNRLERTMPLYQISERDMADLLAYMKQLERDVDPGIASDRVRVGSLLPLAGPQASLGQAMAAVMRAHFEEVNGRGGIFGRRVDLLGIPYGETPEQSLDELTEALASPGIFALVGAYTVGRDQQVLDLLRADGVPLVGPFTLDPGDSFTDSAAFYLYPGFEEQVRALTDHALTGLGVNERVLVVGPEGDRVDRLIRAVEDQLRRSGGAEALAVRYPPGGFDAAGIAAGSDRAGTLIFLGGQNELDALLAVLAGAGQMPGIYLLSSFTPHSLIGAPPEFNERIVIAYPTYSSDVTAQGLADYRGLAERYQLPREHVQAQISALAAARLLVEGLQRAGRDVSRQRFVEGLEGLYAYQTGLTPPLTYGPNRRIGARGAHLVTVDLVNKTYVPVGNGWHDIR